MHGGALLRAGHALLGHEQRAGGQLRHHVGALQLPQQPGGRQLDGLFHVHLPRIAPRHGLQQRLIPHLWAVHAVRRLQKAARDAAPARLLRRFHGLNLLLLQPAHPHRGIAQMHASDLWPHGGDGLLAAGRGQQRGQDDVQRTAIHRRLVHGDPPQVHLPGRGVHAADQDQPLLRAGQQHVQDAQLLGAILSLSAAGDGQMGDGLPPGGQRRIHVCHAQPQLPVRQQAIPAALHAEPLAQAHAEHHREFQSLGFVHRHQPHHVVGLAHGVRHLVVAPGAHPLRVAQKAGQPAALVGLVLRGARRQPIQIGLALLASRQRQQRVSKAGAPPDLREQTGQRHAAGQHPVVLQVAQKRRQPVPQVVVVLRIGGHRVAERALARLGADQRQLRRGDALHGAAQHGDHRFVPAVVLHQRQVRQEHLHLHGVKVPGGALRIGGNARVQKRRQHGRNHRPPGAGQHRDVPVVQLRPLRHQPPDPSGHHGGLALHMGQLGQLVRFLGLVRHIRAAVQTALRQQDQLHRRILALELRAGVQPRQRVVFDLRVAAVHGALKHAVGQFQYGGTGAEIARQRDQPPAVARAVAPVAAQKQRRFGLSEAVDRLLHVAHHEPVVRPGDAGHQLLLHVAGVLILVHEHVAIARPHRRGHLVLPQQRQRHVLQIGKRQRALFGLARAVAAGDVAHQIEQRGHAVRVRAHVRYGLRPLIAQQLCGALHALLRGVAHGLHLLPQRQHRVRPLHALLLARRSRRDLLKRGERLAQIVVLQGDQRLQRLDIRVQRVGIGGCAVGLQRQPDAALRIGHGLPQLLPRGAGQLGQPRRAVASGHLLRLRHPGLRVGPVGHAVVQLHRQLPHLLRPAPKIQPRQVLVHPGIGRLQRLVHGGVLADGVLRVVEDAKRRIHARRLEVRAQKRRAERVNRGYAGRFQPRQLLPAVRVASVRQRRQPLGQLGAHVRRRRAGERDDQHLVHAHALRDQRQDPFHHHGGLSRAGGGGQQQVLAARLNGGGLFFCPTGHGDTSRNDEWPESSSIIAYLSSQRHRRQNFRIACSVCKFVGD